MTFDEVAALQKDMLKAQAGAKLRSSAAGMYQFLGPEAERLRKKLGLKGSDRFTAGVQDMMAREILDEEGYGDFLAGKIDGKTFQKEIAPKWASIALPGTGMSHHGQPVGTATDEMQAVLAAAKADAERAITEQKADPYQQRWR